jgi:hypothetical protein
MKNIFLVPTDKPRYDKYLVINKEGKLCIWDTQTMGSQNTLNPQHIYITDDSEIKEGDWCINTGRLNETIIFPDKIIGKADYTASVLIGSDWKKIILTTDAQLIADGVQAIDDKFLEWFIKNSSCEYVEVNDSKVVKEHIFDGSNDGEIVWEKKIIIPQEEPKQETLEDLLNKKANQSSTVDLDAYANGLDAGAKWQAERSYSEEEVGELVYNIIGQYANQVNIMIDGSIIDRLFEQFKKK